MSRQQDAVTELVVTVAIVVIVLVIGLFWKLGAGFVKCNSYEGITDRETKYSVISGCYVKTPENKWVPHEEMTKSSVVDSK